MIYMSRFPYFWMSGIQIRFPVPWVRADVVKKNATSGIRTVRSAVGPTPKSMACCTSATVGPAAREVQRNMLKQVTIAM